MLVHAERPMVAFYFDGEPVPRNLPLIDHPMCDRDGGHWASFDDLHERRTRLLHCIRKQEEKLAKKSRAAWDSDRKRELNKWLKRFQHTPEVAVPELEKTYQGCLYLIDQWEYLRELIQDPTFEGTFETEDETLILRLLGVPFHQRKRKHALLKIDPELPIDARRAHLLHGFHEQIFKLKAIADDRKLDEDHAYEMETEFAKFHPDKQLRDYHRQLRQIERDLYKITQNTLTTLGLQPESEQPEPTFHDDEPEDADDQAPKGRASKPIRTTPSLVPAFLSASHEPQLAQTYAREWSLFWRAATEAKTVRTKSSANSERLTC